MLTFVRVRVLAGLHFSELSVQYSNDSISITRVKIPVTMYVFDFTLPDMWHFHSQISVDMTGMYRLHLCPHMCAHVHTLTLTHSRSPCQAEPMFKRTRRYD